MTEKEFIKMRVPQIETFNANRKAIIDRMRKHPKWQIRFYWNYCKEPTKRDYDCYLNYRVFRHLIPRFTIQLHIEIDDDAYQYRIRWNEYFVRFKLDFWDKHLLWVVHAKRT